MNQGGRGGELVGTHMNATEFQATCFTEMVGYRDHN